MVAIMFISYYYYYFIKFNFCVGCCITYGELFDTFEEIEDEANLFSLKLRERYPNVKVGRLGRLLDTVKRLIAPTRPSTVGSAKLLGSPLKHYQKRFWEPCIRTTSTSELNNYYCSNGMLY